LNYYNNSAKILQDLSRQIGGAGIQQQFDINNNSLNNLSLNNIQANGSSNHSVSSKAFPNASGASMIGAGLNKKKAKVLFDFEASDPSEISVYANQVNLF
jgi:hypothetical protein